MEYMGKGLSRLVDDKKVLTIIMYYWNHHIWKFNIHFPWFLSVVQKIFCFYMTYLQNLCFQNVTHFLQQTQTLEERQASKSSTNWSRADWIMFVKGSVGIHSFIVLVEIPVAYWLYSTNIFILYLCFFGAEFQSIVI